MTIKQETEFLRRTKNYIIEINDKEIEVIKKWYIDDIANDYDVDRLGNKLGKVIRNQIRSTGGGLAWS